jgi:hypothetical protein
MEEYGGLTAKMATLAVFARSSNTIAGAMTALGEWPGASWPRNTAHKHVRTLAQSGELRLVARGNEPSLDRFEITPKGQQTRREWLVARIVEPVARDTALGRLCLCQTREDAVCLVEALKAEEALYEGAYAEAHARSTAARRARLRSAGRNVELRTRLADIIVSTEASLWDDMVTRISRVRGELETFLAEEATTR